jgi:hypothetical protein
LIRAKAFVCCDRGAPSHYDKEIIEEIPLEIMEAMKKRHITVRRWCQSYGFDLCDLWYQVNPNKEILLSLQEDFPEVFGLQLQEYKTAPVCCDRKSFFGGKMGRHIIWSNYYNIRVQHTRENEAIRLFNWRKSLVIVKRRLQIYLEKGLAEALAWPPSELVRVSIDRKTEQKRKLTDDPAEVARKEKLHEAMQRESEIDSLIRKIAALPLPQFCRRDDRAKELELQTILTETYGVSLKKIDYDVYKIRWDANRY